MADMNQAAIETLNAWMKAQGDELIVSLASPMKATMKFLDGGFKVKPLLGNEEFFLRRCRSGARAETILEFEPVAAAAYVQVEMRDKLAFGTFAHEDLENKLVRALGVDEKNGFEKALRVFAKQQAERAIAGKQAETERDYGREESWGIF